MKKLILVFLLLPMIGHAQFNRGDVFLGGSAGFTDQNAIGNNNGGSVNNTNTFSASPKVGYFVNDRWAIGGTLGYSATNTVFGPSINSPLGLVDADKMVSNTFSVGVFGRRYFAIADKFLFTLEGAINFSRGNMTTTIHETEITTGSTSTFIYNTPSYSLGASIRPLFIFFPSPKWGLEAGLGSLSFVHQRNLSNNTGVAGQNTFNVTGSSTVSFGIYYYFRRHG